MLGPESISAAPLAHDPDGKPLALPPEAVGWRVRRPVGGRGRPRVVYNAAGSPLRLRRSATLEDLRAAGCAPGAYHLDAIDREGNPVGITAFTEVIDDGGDGMVGDAPPASGGSGADVRIVLDSLVRTMESLHRSIVERDRIAADRERAAAERDHALAGILGSLGQRFAAPLEDIRDLRQSLKEERSQLAGEPPLAVAHVPAAPGAQAVSQILEQLGPAIAAFGQSLCWRVLGVKPEEIAALVAQQTQAGSTGGVPPVPGVPFATASVAPIPPELSAVFAELSLEEAAAARAVWGRTPETTRDLIVAELADKPPRQAADFVRNLLRGLGQKPNGANGANGKHAT